MALIKFEYFLSKFPEVDLPVTLSEDIHFDFSRENDPLSDAMIEEYIRRYETNGELENDGDLTEYVPCFKLKDGKNYYAVVYWKATLLQYDYFVATYNKIGALIDKRSIAGSVVKNDALIITVATLTADGLIFIAQGSETHSGDFDASAAKLRQLELTEDGFITG